MNTETTEMTAAPFEVPPIQEPHQQEGFVIDNAQKADWLVRKVVEERLRRERVKEWAAEETRDSLKEEADLLERFEPQLKEWAGSELASAKTKTLKLPNGAVSFRTQPHKLEVVDEEAALTWAIELQASRFARSSVTFDSTNLSVEQMQAIGAILKEAGVEVTTSESLNKIALTEWFKATGDVPEGCKHIPEHEKLYIK